MMPNAPGESSSKEHCRILEYSARNGAFLHAGCAHTPRTSQLADPPFRLLEMSCPSPIMGPNLRPAATEGYKDDSDDLRYLRMTM